MGIMHVPTVQAAGESKERQHCSSSPLPHTLVIPASKRCYKGTDEVFAGLIYQELEEHKALCILHKPMELPCATAESHQAVAVAGDYNSSSTADESSAGSGITNEFATPGALRVEGGANLSCTTPLAILADGQDLTRFHVCLSSPGIQTVVDGVSYIHTLAPVDVLSQKRITLKPVSWRENEEGEACSHQNLSSDDDVCKKGVIECGIVASHIAPSQWEFLASSDCLVAAVAICEKKRLQLATAKHLCTKEQIAGEKIVTLRREYRRVSEEQKNQDGISEIGSIFLGLTGSLGTHKLPTSKQTLLLSPDIAYLMETVVPVLYPALEAILRDRPDDPLVHLAFFLLRHSTGYSRTAAALQHSGAV